MQKKKICYSEKQTLYGDRSWKSLLQKFVLRCGFRKKIVGFFIEVTLNNAGFLVS